MVSQPLPPFTCSQVNFFVLVSVLCAVRDRGGAVGGGSGCGGGGGGGTAGRAARVQSAARATLMLTPVLGLTWTAGVFTVDHAASAVFQYVFAGVNSLQVRWRTLGVFDRCAERTLTLHGTVRCACHLDTACLL